MWGLGFPAPWTMLLPRDPQLFEPLLKRTALKEENAQQQDNVEEQGKVEDRHVGLGNLSDSASESYGCGFDGQV